jgi:deoxyribonuclease-4
VCLDSCHLFASGYDIRTPAGMDALLEMLAAEVGLERVRSLHLNDSQGALGCNRDRHANVGRGELGERGCATFLAAAPFEDLPCVLETPGVGGPQSNGGGPAAEEIALANKLRERGVRARRRRPARR